MDHSCSQASTTMSQVLSDSFFSVGYPVLPHPDPSAGPSTSTPAVSPSPKKVFVTLLDKSLWDSFHAVGNEMIVTRVGRLLFPAPVVTVRGLDPSLMYNITLKVASADPNRYKYFGAKWSSVGESEVIQNEQRQVYHHSDSPNTGSYWMKRPISFKSVKITHFPNSKKADILIHTMHKYVLEIIVSPMNGSPSSVTTLQETSFIAVSCYQNPKLTQLKIQYNQYAKGFRAPIPSRSPKVYAYGHGLLPSFSSLIPSAASPSFKLPKLPPISTDVDCTIPIDNGASPQISSSIHIQKIPIIPPHIPQLQPTLPFHPSPSCLPPFPPILPFHFPPQQAPFIPPSCVPQPLPQTAVEQVPPPPYTLASVGPSMPLYPCPSNMGTPPSSSN